MPIGYDVGAVLRTVVVEVFLDDVAQDWSPDPDQPHHHQVLLGSGDRKVGLQVDGEWCDLTLLPSGNGLTSFFEGPLELEEALRELALIGRSYLQGRFRVTRRRGLLGTREVLTVITGDGDGERRFRRGLLGSQITR